ncbi:hypothetical protein [Aldersonia kunmingensis]|uniref:hypothetical protein n=1 Tax=Aldersonia kunmingensis TaxID=408066 RepID=UPI000835B7F8|nr:hypothetical protein [Aldersonia kunmingensis]
MAANPIQALLSGVEEFLAQLDDKQFADLVARTRQPKGDKNPSPDQAPEADYPSSWHIGGGR